MHDGASLNLQFIPTLQYQIPDPDILLDPAFGRDAHPFGLSRRRGGMFNLSFEREMP